MSQINFLEGLTLLHPLKVSHIIRVSIIYLLSGLDGDHGPIQLVTRYTQQDGVVLRPQAISVICNVARKLYMPQILL